MRKSSCLRPFMLIVIALGVVLTSSALAQSTSSTGDAYSFHGGRLLRTDLGTGNTADIGPLTPRITKLAFGPGGHLYGVGHKDSRVSALYEIDPDTGDSVELPFTTRISHHFAGFTVDVSGVMWVTESPPVSGRPNILHSWDPATGIHNSKALDTPIKNIAMKSWTLYGISQGSLYQINPATGRSTLVLQGSFFFADYGMDFDSDGYIWFSKVGAVDPPFGPNRLERLNPEDGEVLSRFQTPGGSTGLAVTTPTACDEPCLQNGRFSVDVSWRDFAGNTGEGSLVPLEVEDSALFWFFHPDNWELLVKVIDGCGMNDHFWFFAAATTNVRFDLVVRDHQTGAERSYRNDLGESAQAITDTQAFATCP